MDKELSKSLSREEYSRRNYISSYEKIVLEPKAITYVHIIYY